MTTGTTFARGSALGAAASLIRVLPLGDGQQLFTHRRIGKGVDPRIEAAPADGARQVCAKLCDGHLSHSYVVLWITEIWLLCASRHGDRPSGRPFDCSC